MCSCIEQVWHEVVLDQFAADMSLSRVFRNMYMRGKPTGLRLNAREAGSNLLRVSVHVHDSHDMF